MSRFVAETASGEQRSSSFISFSMASSSLSTETALEIKPKLTASSAEKRCAFNITRLAFDGPIRRRTNGEIVAGSRPSKTSVNENKAPSTATAMSQQAIKPTAPPKDKPLIRPISGLLSWSSSPSISESSVASAILSSLFCPAISCIQRRSAPAQKDFPEPLRITARISGSAFNSTTTFRSSRIISRLIAL